MASFFYFNFLISWYPVDFAFAVAVFVVPAAVAIVAAFAVPAAVAIVAAVAVPAAAAIVVAFAVPAAAAIVVAFVAPVVVAIVAVFAAQSGLVYLFQPVPEYPFHVVALSHLVVAAIAVV